MKKLVYLFTSQSLTGPHSFIQQCNLLLRHTNHCMVTLSLGNHIASLDPRNHLHSFACIEQSMSKHNLKPRGSHNQEQRGAEWNAGYSAWAHGTTGPPHSCHKNLHNLRDLWCHYQLWPPPLGMTCFLPRFHEHYGQGKPLFRFISVYDFI